jgi:hypothetical protein
MHITAGICTKDRYNELSLCLLSIINQTRPVNKLIIYDDSVNRVDLREEQIFKYLFYLLESKKIEWSVLYGARRGQHIGHQYIQREALELVYRLDDDEVAEANVLEKLESHFLQPKSYGRVGAVAGLVIDPRAPTGEFKPNLISTVDSGNCQWYRWHGIKDAEHLYSSYLYKKGIQDFDTNLSPVAHREETLHTYGIFKKGYRLIVDSTAVTYHFRAESGGIRSEGKQEHYYRDEIAFQEILREYEGTKVCFLDSGMGDHLVFKSILPKIKEKYPNVILAVCYPELFPGEICISLDEGFKICNPERHNIFKWCIDHH